MNHKKYKLNNILMKMILFYYNAQRFHNGVILFGAIPLCLLIFIDYKVLTNISFVLILTSGTLIVLHDSSNFDSQKIFKNKQEDLKCRMKKVLDRE